MKLICQEHQDRYIKFICAFESCKQRLLCPMCLKDHYNHGPMINIEDFRNCRFTDMNAQWCCPKVRQVVAFIQNQKLLDFHEIEYQVENMFNNFLIEIQYKLKQIQLHLTKKLQEKHKEALDNFQYLYDQLNQLFNMEEIHSSLNKYQNQIFSKTIIDEILKNFFSKINGNTEILNIYNYMTQGGLNHNYLDIVQIDVPKFHTFKSKIMSQISKIEDFEELILSHHHESMLPFKNNPSFSWQMNEKIINVAKVNKLCIKDGVIIAVCDDKIINSYYFNGKPRSRVHKSEGFYLAVEMINKNTIVLCEWQKPMSLQIYYKSKLCNVIQNVSSHPVKQISLINKYNLYGDTEQKFLILDSQGTLNIVGEQIAYGVGVQEFEVLPDTKHAQRFILNPSLDFMLDLIVCSYSFEQIKICVRSVFRPLPISKINDDEWIEQSLGFTDHCKVQFRVMKLASQEKVQFKLDTDYAVVTFYYNTLQIWNWKTGQIIRSIEAGEAFGLRFLPVYNGMQQILLLGLDSKIYCVNWLNKSVITSRFKFHNYQINQCSAAYHSRQNQSLIELKVVLKQQGGLIFSTLKYY